MKAFGLTIIAGPSISHIMLSIAECRKILNTNKKNKEYSEEEIIKIRNWVNNMTDIVSEITQKNGIDTINEIIGRENPSTRKQKN